MNSGHCVGPFTFTDRWRRRWHFDLCCTTLHRLTNPSHCHLWLSHCSRLHFRLLDACCWVCTAVADTPQATAKQHGKLSHNNNNNNDSNPMARWKSSYMGCHSDQYVGCRYCCHMRRTDGWPGSWQKGCSGKTGAFQCFSTGVNQQSGSEN